MHSMAFRFVCVMQVYACLHSVYSSSRLNSDRRRASAHVSIRFCFILYSNIIIVVVVDCMRINVNFVENPQMFDFSYNCANTVNVLSIWEGSCGAIEMNDFLFKLCTLCGETCCLITHTFFLE